MSSKDLSVPEDRGVDELQEGLIKPTKGRLTSTCEYPVYSQVDTGLTKASDPEDC